jgi:hypothetical protein
MMVVVDDHGILQRKLDVWLLKSGYIKIGWTDQPDNQVLLPKEDLHELIAMLQDAEKKMLREAEKATPEG